MNRIMSVKTLIDQGNIGELLTTNHIATKHQVPLFQTTMVTVQSTVDTGHEDMIHDAQMDFYGTRLATCSR